MSKITNQRNQDDIILILLKASSPLPVGGLSLARASGSRSLPARISALRAVGWDITATSDENCPEGMSKYSLASVIKGKPQGRVQVFVDLPEHPNSRAGGYWSPEDAKMIQSVIQKKMNSIIEEAFPGYLNWSPSFTDEDIDLSLD
jgi:hypothetical protein